MYDRVLCFLVPAVAVYVGCLLLFQAVFKRIPRFHLLLPKGACQDNCRDIEGYFKDSNLQLAVLMIISALFGVVDIYAVYGDGAVQPWLQNGIIVLYIVFLAYFSKVFSKITDKYWDIH